MLVSLTIQSNLSIPVYKNMLKKIFNKHQEIKKDTYLNAQMANTSAIR